MCDRTENRLRVLSNLHGRPHGSFLFSQLKKDDRCDHSKAPQYLQWIQYLPQEEVRRDARHHGFPCPRNAGPRCPDSIDSLEIKTEGDEGREDRNVDEGKPDLEGVTYGEHLNGWKSDPAEESSEGKSIKDERPCVIPLQPFFSIKGVKGDKKRRDEATDDPDPVEPQEVRSISSYDEVASENR